MSEGYRDTDNYNTFGLQQELRQSMAITNPLAQIKIPVMRDPGLPEVRAAYALGQPVFILSTPRKGFVTVETMEGHTTGSWDARLITLAEPPDTDTTIYDLELQHVSIDVVNGLGFKEKT